MRLMLIFLLFPFILGAQQMYDSPASPEFQQDLAERQRQFESLPDTMYGVDPIEEMPIAPTAYDILSGSYVQDFYEMPKWASWVRSAAKRTVWVFILDTGGETSHPALIPFADPSLNANFTSDPPFDKHGHSTHVAGCVAGKHPTGAAMGPASVLGPNIKLVFVKVLGDNGSGGETQIARGIDYSADKIAELIPKGGIGIINLSLGGTGKSKVMADAIERAKNKGALVLAAAGNSGREGVGTPANSEYALAVASIDAAGNRSSFSTFGPEVFMAAPGTAVFSSWRNGTYAKLSGTSMATPTAAATAAIAFATSTATADQIAAWTKDRSSQKWDKFLGHGWHTIGRMASDDIGSWKGEWPTDPPPDEGPTEKFTVELSSDVTMTWQPQGSQMRQSNLVIEAEWEATSMEAAEREADSWLRGYFGSVAFVLFSDSQASDAVYWARHFAEMKAKRDGEKASFEMKWRAPSGAAVSNDRPRRRALAFFKRLRGEAQTQYLWPQ